MTVRPTRSGPLNIDLMSTLIEGERAYLVYIRTQHSTDLRCRFGVAGAPSDALALTNCLIVHPQDFPEGRHVLVKQQFPLTTRYVHTAANSVWSSSSTQAMFLLNCWSQRVTDLCCICKLNPTLYLDMTTLASSRQALLVHLLFNDNGLGSL